MKRILLKFLYFFLCFLIFLACLGFFFLKTSTGLHTAIKLSQIYLPGTLHVTQIKGSLFKQFSIEELSYRQDAIEVKLQHLEFQWQPDSLLKPSALTFTLHAEQISIANPALEAKFQNVDGVGLLTEYFLNIQSLKLDYLNQHFVSKAQISTQKPHTFTGTVQLNPLIKDKELLKGLLNIGGNLKNFNWTGEFFGPAEISIQGNLESLFKLQQIIKWRGFHWPLPANESLYSPEGRIQFSGNWDQLKVELNSKVSKSQAYQWQIQALLQGAMPWDWNLQVQLFLNKGTDFLPKLGLDINPIDLNITTKNKHWNLTGSLFSSLNKLIIKGEGPISPEPKATLFVEGDNVSIADTQAFQIKISPKLQLQLSPKEIHVSGTILVPNAIINPATLTDSVVLSNDVILPTSPVLPEDPLNTSMEIQVQLGDEVHLNFKGLKAQLGGMLTLKQNPQQPILANGELLVKKGEFKAYAQDLNIDQGQLFYTGGKLDNPEIHLRASKNINSNDAFSSKMNVGVEVSGKLTAPNIQLFSNPATLSQADMLSMLVLGRPANQANKAGAQLLITALSSMNIGGSDSKASQLIEQMKNTLGFDVNVETNSNYNQITNESKESTGVVVGKSFLSKRIYLSYNVGVSQADPNVLTLKYLLNRYLSLQVSSSTAGNGIDLIYTSDKKRINANK